MLISDSLIFIYIYIHIYLSESTEEEIEDLLENVRLAQEFVEKFSNRYIQSEPSREREEKQYWKGVIQQTRSNN
jgi:hypothetical protein